MEAVFAPFAAIAAHLVTAKRRGHVKGAVDRHLPRAQARGNSAGSFEIIAPDIAGQTIFGVIADGDGFVDRAVAKDRQHRPKDFLAGDGHVVGDIGKDRGLDEIALVQPLGPTGAAGDQGCAFVDASLDQPLDLVELGRRDDRTHGGVAQRVAHDDGGGGFAGGGDHFVHAAAGNQQPGGRAASLARIAHHCLDAGGGIAGKAGVIKQDVGAFAAQFLRHPLDCGRGIARHFNASAGGAGKGHHIHLRVRGQRDANAGAIAIDHIEHACRHACGMHDLGKDLRGKRCHFRWLEHHGAAGRQRRGDLAGDLVEWPVPRGDKPAHADRFFGDVGLAPVFGKGEVLEDGGGTHDMAKAGGGLRAACQRCRGAHFLRYGIGQLRQALLIFGGNRAQKVDALGHA